MLEKLALDLNGVEVVPAYFLRTKHAAGPSPTVLYHHASSGRYDIGKEEILAGRSELQAPPYGDVLTTLGISVLCLDMWAFGERATRNSSEIFKDMLWHGQSLWGMMVYDNLRALDYLEARPDVDASRIGGMGLSMGSTMAWWLAALDPRVAVTVDLCCMTDFDELIRERGLDNHGYYYYVSDLLSHFSTAEINELIAPRPHLCLAGDLDPLTPVRGLVKIDDHLKRVYEEQGEPEAWRMVRFPVGHEETSGMRDEVIAFLRKWL